jgi:CRISPR locus-related DNA-binding protein
MTTFVSTLGFNTSHLYSRIVDEDVSDGDHLVLVRPKDDDGRGEDAVQDIKGMLDKLEEEVTTEVLEFDPNDFEATARRLVERLDEIDDDVIINLAGGDRALILPLTLAVMSTSAEVASTYVRSDVTRESQNVNLPTLHPPLDDRDREVLKYVLENGPVSNRRIASGTDVSESTVSRRVERLEKRGYVEVEDGTGSNSVSLTFPATLVENRL